MAYPLDCGQTELLFYLIHDEQAQQNLARILRGSN